MWVCVRHLYLIRVFNAVDNCQLALYGEEARCTVSKQSRVLLFTVPTATCPLATSKTTHLKYICPFYVSRVKFLVLFYFAVKQPFHLGLHCLKCKMSIFPNDTAFWRQSKALKILNMLRTCKGTRCIYLRWVILLVTERHVAVGTV